MFLWNTVFILTLLVYAVGLFVTIMEPDAAVYAEVSMEMAKSGNFLEITLKGTDWLDKPHFPFWVTAFSYKIFGINSFAYKLPAVLFTLLGVLYTYLFAKKFYTRKHALIAALILMTAEHIIISNNDVRAEPYLTGLTIMGLFHFSTYLANNKIIHVVAGSLALACLIMTKGLFTIIPVVSGIGLTLIYERKWKDIFRWQWLLAAVLTFIFLFPSLYGYYLQFDLHPEKKIFGKNNVSGVEFFLWTSQWGRFTNTGPITGKGDPFYFVHTMLWAFLPWAFIAFYALFEKTKQLIKRTAKTESFTYFGFITLFLLFSASKFQLSFYLNPLFPLLAIVTADCILRSARKKRTLKVFSTMHLVLCILLVIGIFILHYLFFDRFVHADTLIIVLSGLVLAAMIFLQKNRMKKILFAPALVVLAINYYLNRELYPALVTYQAESEMAWYVKKNKLPAHLLVCMDVEERISDVILQRVVPEFKSDTVSALNLTGKYVYTSDAGLEKIQKSGLQATHIISFNDFPITTLTGKFINKKTRSSALQKKHLIQVK